MTDSNRSKFSRRAFVGAAVPTVLAARAKGANDRVRIGVVGSGGRGQYLMGEIKKCSDLNVAVSAVCDVWRPNLEKGARMAAEISGQKARTTVNYQELLSWDDVDAVIISTPDFWHSPILVEAVKAGKDAYCEKPMGTVFSEAKAAYEAVKNSDRVVQIGTQRRSDPYHITAAALLHQGVIGKMTRAETAYNVHSPRWARDYKDAKPEDISWDHFRRGDIPATPDVRLLRQWQLFRQCTNGIAGLWMSHYVDLAHWFSGQPYPKSAVTQGGVYLWKDGRQTADVYYTLLEYPRDFLFSWNMTQTNSVGQRNVWYGDKGILDMDANYISGEGSEHSQKVKARIDLKPAEVNSHMANFIECIRSRQQPRADIQAGFSHAVAGIMSATALDERRLVGFDAEKLEII